MQVLGQHWAAEFLQQNPTLHGPIPDAQHIMDLLCVEHQEVEPERREEAGSHMGLGPFFPGPSGQGIHKPKKDLQKEEKVVSGSVLVIPIQPAPPIEVSSNDNKGEGCRFCASFLLLRALCCHCQIPPASLTLRSPRPHSCVQIHVILEWKADVGSPVGEGRV